MGLTTLEKKTQQLGEDTSSLLEDAKNLQEEAKTINFVDKSVPKENLSILIDRTNLAEKTRKDLELELVRTKESNNFLEILFENFMYLYLVSRILIWVGMMLTFIGFLLWYYKLQRYLDLIIRNEAIEKGK